MLQKACWFFIVCFRVHHLCRWRVSGSRTARLAWGPVAPCVAETAIKRRLTWGSWLSCRGDLFRYKWIPDSLNWTLNALPEGRPFLRPYFLSLKSTINPRSKVDHGDHIVTKLSQRVLGQSRAVDVKVVEEEASLGMNSYVAQCLPPAPSLTCKGKMQLARKTSILVPT